MTVKGFGLKSAEFVEGSMMSTALRLVPQSGGEILLLLTPSELRMLTQVCREQLVRLDPA